MRDKPGIKELAGGISHASRAFSLPPAADPHSSPVCVAAPNLAFTTQAIKLPEALTKE